MFNVVNKPQHNTNWRDSLSMLQKAREKFQQRQMIMTQYEQLDAQEAIKEFKDQAYPSITAGITAEFHAAIDGYQVAVKQYREAVSLEINRWDVSKLTAARTDILQRVDLAGRQSDNPFTGGSDSAGKLAAIYQEAKASGDIVKMRAAGEVITGLKQTHEIISLQVKAKADLETLRVIPEMVQAAGAIDAAHNALVQKHSELGSILAEMETSSPNNPFLHSPLAKEYRRLAADRDGNIIIRDPSDPDVSGVEPLTIK